MKSAGLEKEQKRKRGGMINKLEDKLIFVDNELNRIVLCEICKGKKFKKLTDKCGNKEIARFIYVNKLNKDSHDEFKYYVNNCYGVTKDPEENDYLLVFAYADNGNLHNYLSKNFKEITWNEKISLLYDISYG